MTDKDWLRFEGWSELRWLWIAFASGWWLVGSVLGIQRFVGLLRTARSHLSILEITGAAIGAGIFLPGAKPYRIAAEYGEIEGGQVGFSAFLIGAFFAITVWSTLPLVIRTMDVRVSRRLLGALVVPYVAGIAGITVLARRIRRHGIARGPAMFIAVSGSIWAYLVAAVLMIGLSVGFGIV